MQVYMHQLALVNQRQKVFLDGTTTYEYEKTQAPLERALEQKNGSTKLQCTKYCIENLKLQR